MSGDVDVQKGCLWSDSWGHGVLASVAMLSWFIASANAAIINVPADQPSIQAAIDAAINGDDIVVAPGTYNEAINFSGKAINLKSSGGAAVTIIDGTGAPESVVKCVSGEGPATIFDGFTVQGGTNGTPVGLTFAGLGLYILDSSPTVTNCIFRDNTSNAAETSGGGMYIHSFTAGGPNVTPIISNCQFIDNMLLSNSALHGGGGIGVKNARPTITGCTFIGNRAPDGGGGIAGQGDTVITISDCGFTNNIAGQAGGGIALLTDGGSITDCTFTNNTANGTTMGGGGVATRDSGVLVHGCSFSGNQAGLGGGIDIRNSGMWQGTTLIPSPTVSDCIFDGNIANGVLNGGGGGILVNRATSLIEGCTFQNNSTDSFGGAILITQSGPRVVNCIATNNSAALRGGAMHLRQYINLTQVYYPVISNCTMVSNSVGTPGNGAGLQIEQVAANTVIPARISNCIIRGNTGGSNVVFPTASHPGWVTLQHSNMEGAVVGVFQGSNNIDADPMFVDATNGDYHVLDVSPGIDAGINTDLVKAGVEEDFDGAARIVDFTELGFAWADMGIFEQQNVNASKPADLPVPYVYWHFNTFSGSSPIAADIGSATIDTSTWGGTIAVDPIGAFFDINAVNGTPAGTALQLMQGAGGNGTSIYFNLSMTGRENLKVSFVTKKSHPSSYDNGAWAWSVDGKAYTTMVGVNTCPATNANGISMLQAVDFSGVAELNNADNVTLRYTLTRNAGPPAADRYVSLDNIQINTTPIPVDVPGDITGNGIVDVDDLLIVINAWGPCFNPSNCPADISPPPTGDDIVNVDDLLMVINNWSI